MRFCATLALLAAAAVHANRNLSGPGWQCWCYDADTGGCDAPPPAFTPTAGALLMGGGFLTTEADAGSAWMAQNAGGGPVLVLRASLEDEYNAYIYGMAKVASVTTIKFDNATGSSDPFVIDTIRGAAAIFIAGGDQGLYMDLWNGTAVQAAVQARVSAGITLAGTSAGMAIMSQYAYTAPGGASVTSATALANPYDAGIAIGDWFVHVPLLGAVLTDTHFFQRDRMGRTLAFLARVLQDYGAAEVHAVACAEQSAVQVDPASGRGRVVNQATGPDHACYFLGAWGAAPRVCRPDTPLSLANVTVFRASAAEGGEMDLSTWRPVPGSGGAEYVIAAAGGAVLQSQQPGGSVY